jgi:casein kinase I family protein HRR25
MELINNKYKILTRIGSGCFGTIYSGKNIRTGENVAIKVEPICENIKLLKNETNIYQYLNGCEGIPSVKWFGKDATNYYMVMPLLGKSLQNIMDEKGRFSLPLICKLGIKIIGLLKTIHDKGLVHRDIKPDNFLFTKEPVNDCFVYLIDFGFCKVQSTCCTKTHNTIGSKNYASIHSHAHCELSRRDDVESLCYMLLYFASGHLPWNCMDNENDIILAKNAILYDTTYPAMLIELLQYVRILEFHESPNYYLIINKLNTYISSNS